MAEGDVFVFEEFALDVASGVHDFSSDEFKVCFLNNDNPPAASQATPTYSDFSGDEVSGNGYSAGGQVITVTLSEADGVATIDYSAEVFSQSSGGPDDIYHALFYNNTAASKNAIAVMDMGGPVDLDAGDLTVDAHASGLATITVNNP